MLDVEKQRQRMETLLAHLERRTSAVERDLRRQDSPLERDWEEQAIQLENDEVLVRLAEDGPAQIDLIRRALTRLDAGVYARCVDCGGEIAATRLEALPYAVRCIHCEERHESEAGR